MDSMTGMCGNCRVVFVHKHERAELRRVPMILMVGLWGNAEMRNPNPKSPAVATLATQAKHCVWEAIPRALRPILIDKFDRQ